MIKITDLTFFCNEEFQNSSELIEGQEESLGYAFHLQEQLHINVIKHTRFRETRVVGKITFDFFKGSNRFGYFSVETARHLRADPPDVILLQGMIFPLQVLLLRMLLGKKPVIIAQHHGEQPLHGFKSLLQKLADKYINKYIFTSSGNAAIWLDQKVIGSAAKCNEILEASTRFRKQDKTVSKAITGLNGDWNFIWVGRLNANKDPLTVLHGFDDYLALNASAKLYLIFHTDEMLAEVKAVISKSTLLYNAVHLVGKIKHQELQSWYSAADFFLSGSHREGSGFALIEAMSCGCIPVITNIPTFKKISGNGKYAVLYKAGEPVELFHALEHLSGVNREAMSEGILTYFQEELSFEAIAEKISKLVMC